MDRSIRAIPSFDNQLKSADSKVSALFLRNAQITRFVLSLFILKRLDKIDLHT